MFLYFSTSLQHGVYIDNAVLEGLIESSDAMGGVEGRKKSHQGKRCGHSAHHAHSTHTV